MADRLIELDSANIKDTAHRDIVEALVVVGKQIMIDCMRDLQAITDNNIIVTDIESYSTDIYNVDNFIQVPFSPMTTPKYNYEEK